MKFRTLKILSDENISPRVVSFLRGEGVDVSDVKEKGWQGSEDRYLMEKAFEEKRIIITHDSDFGTLAIHEGVHCYGIIYIKLKYMSPSNVINVLNKLMMLETDIIERSLIVVEDKKLRIRTVGESQ